MRQVLVIVGCPVMLIVMSLLVTTAAQGASIGVNGDDVYLNGGIGPRDDRAFIATISNNAGVKRVVLDYSEGGNIEVSIAIADRIRTWGLSTHVVTKCASACVLIWAAGKPRTLSEHALLGVHCAHLEPFNECDAEGTKEAIEYLKEVRAPEGLIRLIESAGPFMVWVSPEDLREATPPNQGRPP